MYIDLQKNVFDQLSSGELFLENNSARRVSINKEKILKVLDYNPSDKTIKTRYGHRIKMILNKNVGSGLSVLKNGDHDIGPDDTYDTIREKFSTGIKFKKGATPTIIINPELFKLKSINNILAIIEHEIGHAMLQSMGSSKTTKTRTHRQMGAPNTPSETIYNPYKQTNKDSEKYRRLIKRDDIRYALKYHKDQDAKQGRQDREDNINVWKDLLPESDDGSGRQYIDEFEADAAAKEVYPKNMNSALLSFKKMKTRGFRKQAEKELREFKKANPDATKEDIQKKKDELSKDLGEHIKRMTDDIALRKRAMKTPGIKTDVYKHAKKYTQSENDKEDAATKRAYIQHMWQNRRRHGR